MPVQIPFGSAAQAGVSLTERAAQTLDNLNNSDHSPVVAEMKKIAERALDALLKTHAVMTNLTTPQGRRALEINLVGIRQNAKMRGNYEAKLAAIIDGLEERGGVWKGERLHIRTNDPDIENRMRALEEKRSAKQPAYGISLQHDVTVPASPNIRKRTSKPAT